VKSRRLVGRITELVRAPPLARDVAYRADADARDRGDCRRVADVLVLDADPTLDLSALETIRTLVFRGAVVDRGGLLPHP
jgi:hypothetical protein